MGSTIPNSSKIENNSYLKDAFSSCRRLDITSGTSSSIFDPVREYNVGDKGKVDISGKNLATAFRLFYGYDFNKMRDDGNLYSFEYDKDGDGNFEVQYEKKDNIESIGVDKDSDGKLNEFYKYEDGVLRQKTTFSADGKSVATYTTYDKNGNEENLGQQAENILAVCITNLLLGKWYEMRGS